MEDISSRLREAESLALRRQEAFAKAEKEAKISRDALTAAEEEIDEEKRKAERRKEEAEEAEENAAMAEKRATMMQQRVETLEKELGAIQVRGMEVGGLNGSERVDDLMFSYWVLGKKVDDLLWFCICPRRNF